MTVRFLLSIFILSFASLANATITYTVAPQGSFEPGWSFDGGTITTDGTIGVLGTSNILSWTINYTSPATVNSLTNANSTLSFNPLINGDVTATASALTLQPDASAPFGQVAVSIGDGVNKNVQLTASSPLIDGSYFLFDAANTADTSSFVSFAPGPITIGTAAAVPEPSSLAVLLFGTMWFGSRRRLRDA